MKEEVQLVIKRITTNLLKTNVDNVDKEAKSRRFTRQQMLDLILEERYKNTYSSIITAKKNI